MNVERSTVEAKKINPVQSFCRVQSRRSLKTVRLLETHEQSWSDVGVTTERIVNAIG